MPDPHVVLRHRPPPQPYRFSAVLATDDVCALRRVAVVLGLVAAAICRAGAGPLGGLDTQVTVEEGLIGAHGGVEAAIRVRSEHAEVDVDAVVTVAAGVIALNRRRDFPVLDQHTIAAIPLDAVALDGRDGVLVRGAGAVDSNAVERVARDVVVDDRRVRAEEDVQTFAG